MYQSSMTFVKATIEPTLGNGYAHSQHHEFGDFVAAHFEVSGTELTFITHDSAALSKAFRDIADAVDAASEELK